MGLQQDEGEFHIVTVEDTYDSFEDFNFSILFKCLFTTKRAEKY